MQVAELQGLAVHYADQGPRDGRAVVFGNSLGTDLRVWDAVLPLLPQGLRLVRYDKRGHGLTQATPGPYSIGQLADDAAALMDHLGLRDAVFVGLSIGGLIGQSLAARRPDLLRGLVLSNTAAKIGTPELWRDRIATIRAGGIEAIGAATMERWFSPAFRETTECRAWQMMLERQPLDAYAAACEAIAAADLREATATLRLPTLAIAGELDGATPPEIVRDTAALIPGARFEVLPGAGHLPGVEVAPAYAALLTRFLEELG
ncbi:3-oxoadipate enol-lactonase [Paracoccus chinensis]|uniref:3-oxoadipate enol-lactonase n=1 Tax=Paracoccus chinensis TaxID=525640 RepID=A0A1G9G3J6_9RHOB|nr:3-oxoadipate enol-lactonase [Paracoccus chinensis]SDK95226.1 3-oxoadipate enol-lactonase [Paracoccus chinensis]